MKKVWKPTWLLIFNPHAWWVGVHYSAWYRRWCINIIPCVTICYVEYGGTAP